MIVVLRHFRLGIFFFRKVSWSVILLLNMLYILLYKFYSTLSLNISFILLRFLQILLQLRFLCIKTNHTPLSIYYLSILHYFCHSPISFFLLILTLDDISSNVHCGHVFWNSNGVIFCCLVLIRCQYFLCGIVYLIPNTF